MQSSLGLKASRRYGTLSPLRYPGGKSALAGLFTDVIEALELPSIQYVEPYAGGAGAGLALLREGIIDHLVINDIDPAIHAFWSSIVERNQEFVELVKSVPLTIDEWQRQKDIYRSGIQEDVLLLGFSFFYLNRTNRSGILNAGVIGGRSQAGNYKIDARFNRETLVERIEAIGCLANRITVTDLDGRSVIQHLANDELSFMYIDPPYINAGKRLYLNAFDARDHKALASIVSSIEGANWLITYDVMPFVQHLYRDFFQCNLEISYSAHKTGKAQELLVASPRVADTLRGLFPTTTSEIARDA